MPRYLFTYGIVKTKRDMLIKQNVSSAIWQKVNDIPGGLPPLPIDKRADFIYDYSRADDQTLDLLNENDGEMVDFWNQVEYLTVSKSNVKFLLNLKYVLTPGIIENMKGIVFKNRT
jgi:hypothetical protein